MSKSGKVGTSTYLSAPSAPRLPKFKNGQICRRCKQQLWHSQARVAALVGRRTAWVHKNSAPPPTGAELRIFQAAKDAEEAAKVADARAAEERRERLVQAYLAVTVDPHCRNSAEDDATR